MRPLRRQRRDRSTGSFGSRPVTRAMLTCQKCLWELL